MLAEIPVTYCSMVYSAVSAYLTIHHFDPYLLDILDDYKLSLLDHLADLVNKKEDISIAK